MSLISNLTALGIPTPKAITEADEIRLAARSVGDYSAQADLTEQIQAGKLSGKNAAALFTDAARRQFEARETLSVAQSLENVFVKAGNQAIREAADGLLTALRTPFDQAVSDVNASAEVIGHDVRQKAVLELGPAAHRAFTQRTQAIKTLMAVRSVRAELARAGWGPKTQAASWFITSVRDLEHLNAARQAFEAGGIVALIAAGFEMHLNTPEESAALEAGAADRTSRRIDAARKAATAEKAAANRSHAEAWQRVARGAQQPA